FTSLLTGLTGNTLYYVRAYVNNSSGTSYGNQQAFTTSPVLATVTTDVAIYITLTSATSGGIVTSEGGATITDRGVCWSASPNPTISNNKTIDGTGAGVFVSALTGLTRNTPYYVRAYATNNVGTAYGNEITFTTLLNPVAPMVSTAAISNFNGTTATCGGTVYSDGGANVILRGVCWGTNPSPTMADNYSTDGGGIGMFVSSLTGITGNLYYVRSYAMNSVGTSYGNERIVTNVFGQPCPGIPSVTYEGKTYSTIFIGSQCWFKENLNVGTRINGSQEQTNNSIIEKYCYNDDEVNCNIYGGLYQWNEMMQYVSNEGAKGICPTGWHLPTDAEWTTLTTYLGGESVAGGKMKEAGTAHWATPNTGATNSSFFTALPVGCWYSNGNFSGQSWYANFCSSSQYDATNKWYRSPNYSDEDVDRNYSNKADGNSCRCVQD
ncbi:MAG: FISUMP domain-containing protein, partial [Bacteroidota bacterium]